MDKAEIRKLNIRGMMLQAPYWFGAGSYFAYMVTTLLDHGWASSEAAAAITATSIVGMMVQPFYGYICDRFFSEKKLVILLLVLSAVCFIMLPFTLRSESKLPVLLVMTGVVVSMSQVGGLIDAWIVGLKQELPDVNYGLMRGTGSFTYALAAQTMGIVTVTYGHNVRFWLGGVFMMLTLLATFFFRSAKRSNLPSMPTQKRVAEPSTQSTAVPASVTQNEAVAAPAMPERIGGIEALKLVFMSKQYNLLLIVCFLMLMSILPMSTLLQILIRDFGGTVAQIGTALALMAVSEVPFMFFAVYFLKKVGFKKLLILCGILFIVRLFITASIQSVDGLIYIQLMQGLTYALLIPVAMSYLSRILDERIRSTAVTLFTAITVSLTGILGNLVVTLLLAAGFSAGSALIVFGILAVVGLLLALYGVVRRIW